jgi:hypothetical protein
MDIKELPSLEELNNKYSYEPETGLLKSKAKGKIITAKNYKGYTIVRINRKEFMAHRVIWKLMTGEDPGNDLIDHINQVKDDNTWSNLKRRDHSGNLLNNSRPCYHRQGNRWVARVTYKNKLVLYRYFVEEQDAIDAIKEVKTALLK